MEPISKAGFSIVTRTSVQAWLPELIASAGAQVTETYVDFFTSNRSNKAEQSVFFLSEPCCEIKPMIEKEQ
jgi:hypothetical protein